MRAHDRRRVYQREIKLNEGWIKTREMNYFQDASTFGIRCGLVDFLIIMGRHTLLFMPRGEVRDHSFLKWVYKQENYHIRIETHTVEPSLN